MDYVLRRVLRDTLLLMYFCKKVTKTVYVPGEKLGIFVYLQPVNNDIFNLQCKFILMCWKSSSVCGLSTATILLHPSFCNSAILYSSQYYLLSETTWWQIVLLAIYLTTAASSCCWWENLGKDISVFPSISY